MRPTCRGIIHLQPPRQKVLTVNPVNNTMDVLGLKAGMYFTDLKSKIFYKRIKLIINN